MYILYKYTTKTYKTDDYVFRVYALEYLCFKKCKRKRNDYSLPL